MSFPNFPCLASTTPYYGKTAGRRTASCYVLDKIEYLQDCSRHFAKLTVYGSAECFPYICGTGMHVSASLFVHPGDACLKREGYYVWSLGALGPLEICVSFHCRKASDLRHAMTAIRRPAHNDRQFMTRPRITDEERVSIYLRQAVILTPSNRRLPIPIQNEAVQFSALKPPLRSGIATTPQPILPHRHTRWRRGTVSGRVARSVRLLKELVEWIDLGHLWRGRRKGRTRRYLEADGVEVAGDA